MIEGQQMDDRKHIHNSRKIKNLQKRIRELHEQQTRGKRNKIMRKADQKVEHRQVQPKYEGDVVWENGQNQVQHQEQLEQALFSETVANIEKIIHSNDRTIQRLERKNNFLTTHLGNLEKVFNNKNQKAQIHPHHNIEHQRDVSSSYPMESAENKNFFPQDQSCYDSEHNQTEIKHQESKVPSQSRSVKKRKLQNIVRQMQIEPQNHYLRRTYKPSRGPVRYTQQSWQSEQYYVKAFLNNWMRFNIEETPKDPNKSIQKRIILLLYIKWKQLQNLNIQSGLAQAQVQQIMTNEMKIAFRCTCTLREYEGIAFVKKGRNNGDELLQQGNSQEKGKVSSNQMTKKGIELQTERNQDKGEQQFSVELQQQQMYDDQEKSYLYS